MSDRAPSFYPVFLRLAGRRVLLVGGGPVAASKLQGLLDAGAQITVVAPEIVPDIERAARSRDTQSTGEHVDPIAAGHGGRADHAHDADDAGPLGSGDSDPRRTVTLHRRPFDAADLDDVWFVVAAATPEVNRAVSLAAADRQLFVNAVDDPPNATAYLGGVLRRGGVTVAISTDGHAPALAGLLREGLDALLPQDLAAWLDESRAARREWLANGVPMEERRPLLLQALNDIYARRASAAANASASGPQSGSASGSAAAAATPVSTATSAAGLASEPARPSSSSSSVAIHHDASHPVVRAAGLTPTPAVASSRPHPPVHVGELA